MVGFSIGPFRLSRLPRRIVEAATLAVCSMLLFGCSAATVESNPEWIAVKQVAYATCLARQNSPIITEILRQTVDATVPGGEFVHGTVSIACTVVLANPPPIAAAGEQAK